MEIKMFLLMSLYLKNYKLMIEILIININI